MIHGVEDVINGAIELIALGPHPVRLVHDGSTHLPIMVDGVLQVAFNCRHECRIAGVCLAKRDELAVLQKAGAALQGGGAFDASL
jgi:hypothetical protein